MRYRERARADMESAPTKRCMPIQAHVLFRAADGYGSSGTPTPTDVGADPYPPAEVCVVLTRKNCFLFS